jgi:hypothetical protein
MHEKKQDDVLDNDDSDNDDASEVIEPFYV